MPCQELYQGGNWETTKRLYVGVWHDQACDLKGNFLVGGMRE